AGARRFDRDPMLINVGATYVIRGSAGILGPPTPPAPRTIDLHQGTARPVDPGFDPNALDYLPDQVDAVIVGASRNDHSSFDVAAGDLDGDGVDELLIGAIGDLTQTPGYPGEAYLIWFSDGDGDGASDVLDRDSDNDGIADEEEDVNGDGVVGPGETDPLEPDTDGDGIQDGTELGLACAQDGGTVPCDDPNQPFTSTTSLPLFFVRDADPSTSTEPLDLDSDDDGLADASEDPDGDGAATGLETDAALADTDADLVLDGTELGLTVPQPETGLDTNLAAGGFTPDADAGATTTVPTDADTDGDGLGDGVEDRDRMGSVQVGESDPLDQDSDDDGLPDGWIDGVNGQPADGLTTPLEGEDLNLDGSYGRASAESDPRDPDTDADSLPDGLEVGLPVGGMGLPGPDGLPDGGPGGDGTDTTAGHFKADADSGVTVTKPFDADTDDDGLADGVEDVNGDGKAVAPETDATKEDTDGDLILDGTE
ncbi:MAG: hypothetical protein ACRDKW_07195, partial [Actinomycetota bacterium]